MDENDCQISISCYLFSTWSPESDFLFFVLFTHYGEVAEGLAASGDSNLVCYGHSHTFAEKRKGNTLLLNPGEIMGKEGSPGFCLVDTATSIVKRVALPGFC
ncbi:MAG: metallophosphoesterase family protein [Desulfobacterales bacterium]